MRRALVGLGALCGLAACGQSVVSPPAVTAGAPRREAAAAKTPEALERVATGVSPREELAASGTGGAWIGAAAESDVLLTSSGEAFLGVWVDAPAAKPRVRAPVDLALVIDTSGSMAGEKIENARAAARTLVSNLAEGDLVSIDIFSNTARSLVAPTVINGLTRSRVLGAIAELGVGGGTNMFEGLSLGEAHIAQAPATHTVRRIVVISDGIANVGPASPAALGALAERGTQFGAQITSLGVGNDYDEHTLNALAVRTSGRLFHIGDPREMASTLKQEVDLLSSTVASNAIVEVIPAPGVELMAPEGCRAEWSSANAETRSLRIPLGTLFSGQHREALIRMRLTTRATGAPPQRALASVRLRFRDPAEGDLERVQELVAHVTESSDPAEVASHANGRTRAIMAVSAASRFEIAASQQVNQGDFRAADLELASAEAKLKDEAAHARSGAERQRLSAAAAGVTQQRAATRAAAAAPAAVQRNQALQLNQDAFKAQGY